MTPEEIEEAKRDPQILGEMVEKQLEKLDRLHTAECQCWQNYQCMEGAVEELRPLLRFLRERCALSGQMMLDWNSLLPSEN